MIYGTVPFKGDSISELQIKITRGEFILKKSASEAARDLLSKMLELDPKKRITIPQILCHKWFENYNPDISLFNKKEITSLEQDFVYNKIPGYDTTNSDWFVEEDLISSQSELTRNITSKSNILAPFNSYDSKQSLESMYSLILDKRVIKICSKVKDADRQYERNNNCEVDNGVYNNSSYDSESNKQDNMEDEDVESNWEDVPSPLIDTNITIKAEQKDLLESLIKNEEPIGNFY